MKKLALALIASTLLAGCGTTAPLPGVSPAGMADFESMGTDDVSAFATKVTLRKQMKEALEANTQGLMEFADRDPEDRRLTFAELEAKLPGLSRDVFRSKDKDHDGGLVLEELVPESLVTLMTDRVLRIRSGCVKALDKDRDRVLTRADLAEAKSFQLDPQPWSPYAKLELEALKTRVLKDAFASKQVDANQDEKLDYDELYALLRFAIGRGAMPMTIAKPQSPLI